MKLDDWMQQHRSEFDQAEAPEGLWNELKQAVPKEKKNMPQWTWYAAAVLLLSFGFWLGRPSGQEIPDPNSGAQLPSSFLAQEEEYRNDLVLIESQLDLDRISANPEYDWVFEELMELESINAQYRSDLGSSVPKEELLTVLIDYYEKRLRLLHRLQMEIERNQKTIENENISI